ncbi:MAG: hypothetical protein WCJ66_14330 [Verrucomicrobiota bacterium]
MNHPAVGEICELAIHVRETGQVGIGQAIPQIAMGLLIGIFMAATMRNVDGFRLKNREALGHPLVHDILEFRGHPGDVRFPNRS